MRDYLHDLAEYIRIVEVLTVDGREAFLEDIKAQLAVIRAYEVIGEIVKRLPPELLETVRNVNWQEVKAFRDFLAHNYRRVDLEIVWRAVGRLPELRSATATLLESLPPDEDEYDQKE